jgi:hypothetical protein
VATLSGAPPFEFLDPPLHDKEKGIQNFMECFCKKSKKKKKPQETEFKIIRVL